MYIAFPDTHMHVHWKQDQGCTLDAGTGMHIQCNNTPTQCTSAQSSRIERSERRLLEVLEHFAVRRDQRCFKLNSPEISPTYGLPFSELSHQPR